VGHINRHDEMKMKAVNKRSQKILILIYDVFFLKKKKHKPVFVFSMKSKAHSFQFPNSKLQKFHFQYFLNLNQ